MAFLFLTASTDRDSEIQKPGDSITRRSIAHVLIVTENRKLMPESRSQIAASNCRPRWRATETRPEFINVAALIRPRPPAPDVRGRSTVRGPRAVQ
jgi:hypothetical protein